MFIGHFAVGFAAKRAAPRVPLAVLFAAAQLADLLWPLFVAVGLEQVRIDPGNTAFTPLEFVSYPYSHSLLMLFGWGLLFAWASRRFDRRARTFALLVAVVLSHWVLDFVTHRPDMPLYPSGEKLGLSLWNHVAATFLIELALFALGLWSYVRISRARDAIGRWAFVGLLAFLLLAYVSAFASGPPPSVAAIWITGLLGGAIILIWTVWVERHRTVDG